MGIYLKVRTHKRWQASAYHSSFGAFPFSTLIKLSAKTIFTSKLDFVCVFDFNRGGERQTNKANNNKSDSYIGKKKLSTKQMSDSGK